MSAVCSDCGQRINPEVDEELCLSCAAAQSNAADDCTRDARHTDIDVLKREAKACRCDDCIHLVRYINGLTS